MTLSEWIKNTWKHVTLDTVIVKNGSTLNVPEINQDLTMGLLSTSNLDEFKKLVFHFAPIGTIVDDIPEDYYEGQILKLRQLLTKELMMATQPKVIQKYLEILDRRDREHWGKDTGKQLKVEQKEDRNLSITFDIV